MSYILEALKKAEQQRELGRVPGIASDHDAKSAARQRGWLWALLLAVNAAVLLTVLWSARQPERAAEAVAEMPAEPPGTRVETVQPMVEPQQATQPLPREEPATAGRAPGVDAPEAPAKRSVEAAPAPPRPPPAQPLELPVWPQVPQHIFDQVNSDLRLDVHVYSDRPRERFVLMNLRKYREGDALEEGPRLDEIIPEGVVLSFRGQRFRVQRQ